MSSKGQSVIEIVIAVSLMVIIAAGSVTAILGSFNSSRLAKEQSQASMIASAGLEAVRSIRNQSWTNLTSGNHGLSSVGGTWAFSGGSDQDSSQKFTRTITISDGPGADTKTILSRVTWDFTPSRHNAVEMTLLLTDWQQAKSFVSDPSISTCNGYCPSVGYATGTCRATVVLCTTNNETNIPGGNVFCTGGPNEDTCCCAN